MAAGALSTAPQRRLRDFLAAAPVLWLLVRRDIQTRYAGSTLGVFWNLIHPLILVGIYITVFSQVMVDRAGGESRLDYVIHLTSGIIPFLFFQEVVGRCTTALVDNGLFLKRVAIPEEVLHAGIFINAFLIHGTSMVALAVLLLVMGVPLGPGVLLAFPVMVALGAFGAGLGMLLSVLHLLVRDIGQLVNIGLQFLFWLTPIVYFATILPDSLRPLTYLNPIHGYVSFIQRLFGSPQHYFVADSYHVMVILPFAAVLFGLSFLRQHRSEVLDAI